jgi:hypothetical protein
MSLGRRSPIAPRRSIGRRPEGFTDFLRTGSAQWVNDYAAVRRVLEGFREGRYRRAVESG